MLNNVKSIKIEGNHFFENNILSIFDTENERFSFVYGKNGSGKSTISKAFNYLKDNETDDFSSVCLLDRQNKVISISEDDKKKIHVFNEDFIDEYVKIPDDGMNAIVMFGDQIKIDDQLKDEEKILENLKKNLERNNIKLNEFEDPKSSKSPQYYKNVLIDKIKDIYYTNDMKIKNNTRKSSYNEKVFDDIKNAKYKKDVSSEEKMLNDNIKFIANIDSDSKTYSEFFLLNVIDSNFDKKLINLLCKKIDEPVFSEREKRIFKVFTSKYSNYIEESKTFFENKDNNYCPYCFQPVDEKHKTDLLHDISTVLNKEVELHKNELELLKLEEVDAQNINDYLDLDKHLVDEISKSIREYNSYIEKINIKIQDKINNVFVPIKIDKSEVNSRYNKIKDCITKLNIMVKNYNDKVTNLNNIKNESFDLNTLITKNKLKTDFELYDKLTKEYENTKNTIDLLDKNIQIHKQNIGDLKAQKKSYTIAMNDINSDLKYIFMDRNRLTLEHDGEKYIIKSRGIKVPPKKVSVGERNAIALSYFFTTIMNNIEKNQKYKNDFCLIIDDPISSFDNDNKIGIYSFLRSKISKIINNNPNNRVLIFTHSIEAMFNFNAYQDDFGKEYSKLFNYYIIKNKNIDKFDGKKDKNIYSIVFNKVYDYAAGNPGIYEYEIGNIIRKVLEGFSTFECKCGINELTKKKSVLKKIPPSLEPYYENLMYRLFLNGESHFVNSTYSILDHNYFIERSDEEKVKISQSLLVLMYLINDIHVEGQLGEEEKLNNIKKWKEELVKEQS